LYFTTIDSCNISDKPVDGAFPRLHLIYFHISKRANNAFFIIFARAFCLREEKQTINTENK